MIANVDIIINFVIFMRYNFRQTLLFSNKRSAVIRHYLILIFGFIMVVQSAHSLEFIDLNKEVFDAKVVGKTWLQASVDSTIKLQHDGSVTADGPKGKFVGEWEFIDGNGLCLEGDFAGKKFPYFCQEVKLVGDRILIFYNKKFPDGNPYILDSDVSLSTSSCTSTSSSTKIDKAKSTCADIGFTAGTEKFGECVLKVMDN